MKDGTIDPLEMSLAMNYWTYIWFENKSGIILETPEDVCTFRKCFKREPNYSKACY